MTPGQILYLSDCTILPEEPLPWTAGKGSCGPLFSQVWKFAGAESQALHASLRLLPQPALQMGHGAQLGPSQGVRQVQGRALGDRLQNKGAQHLLLVPYMTTRAGLR